MAPPAESVVDELDKGRVAVVVWHVPHGGTAHVTAIVGLNRVGGKQYVKLCRGDE